MLRAIHAKAKHSSRRSPSSTRQNRSVIRNVPIVTERDIVAFYPFHGADGTFGCYFKLDANGTNKLLQHTVEYRDTLVVAIVNGRVACAMMVGQKITDGIMPFPSGFLSREIVELQARYPIIGKRKGISRAEEKGRLRRSRTPGRRSPKSPKQTVTPEMHSNDVRLRAAAFFFLSLGTLAGGAAH